MSRQLFISLPHQIMELQVTVQIIHIEQSSLIADCNARRQNIIHCLLHQLYRQCSLPCCCPSLSASFSTG